MRYIDGKDVRGLVPEDVRPLILGKPGTFVTLSVQRGNTQIVARMARARPSTGTNRPTIHVADQSVSILFSNSNRRHTFLPVP